jgi:hypothetical protein
MNASIGGLSPAALRMFSLTARAARPYHTENALVIEF